MFDKGEKKEERKGMREKWRESKKMCCLICRRENRVKEKKNK